MNDNNKELLEIRPDDFRDIENELKREGKDDKIEIKNINIVPEAGSWWRRRYNVRYRHNPKHLWLDIILLLGLAALVALNVMYWLGGWHYFVDKLEVRVRPQVEGVMSGGEARFVVEYENKNSFDLQIATLTTRFPENFVLTDVSRTDFNRESNSLFLGTLVPGANGQVVFTGKVLGDLEKKQVMAANISYYKTNKVGARLWGQFQKIVTYEYYLAGSKVAVNFTLPQQLISGQEMTVPLTIDNSTDYEFEEVMFQLTPTAEFTVIDPGSDYIDGFWRFYQVTPGRKIERDIKVKVNSRQLSIDGAAVMFTKYNGQYWKQWQQAQRRDILVSDFNVSSKFDREIVRPGESVNYEMTMDNGGQYNIENVSLRLTFPDSLWDLKSIAPKIGRLENNILIIDNQNQAALNLIMPAEKKTLTLKIKTLSASAATIPPELNISAEVTYEVNGTIVTVHPTDAILKLSSNLNVRAFARYFTPEGEQLGRGPLPPVVGKETRFWIFLQLLNDVNAMEDVTITARVPANVDWTNRTDVPVGSAVAFDPGTRKISWSISKVKVNPGNIGAAFEVALTPTAGEIGQFAALLDNIVITGRDSFTKERISQSVNSVTTDLVMDTLGQEKGGKIK